MLKLFVSFIGAGLIRQPPPRGYVLKQILIKKGLESMTAAASARLCVETLFAFYVCLFAIAAASARLCVETNNATDFAKSAFAAASARLCVETTGILLLIANLNRQPPPRGCVLKLFFVGFALHIGGSRLRAAVC